MVDTPGLSDNDFLTQLTFKEIEQSDLVLIVLQADKFLSQSERETIQYINNLLNGNLIFVVNKMGLVEEEEKEDIINSFKRVLQGLGNRFTGTPHIMLTDSLACLKSKTLTDYKLENTEYLQNLQNFKLILQNLFIKQFSERTILISRLGIIHTSFNDLRFLYENKINTLQAIIINFEQEAQQDLKIKKEIFDENIMALKRELIQLKQELVQSREELSRKVIDIAIKLINEHNPYWINQLNYQWDSLYKTYFQELEQKVTLTLKLNQISVPRILTVNTI